MNCNRLIKNINSVNKTTKTRTNKQTIKNSKKQQTSMLFCIPKDGIVKLKTNIWSFSFWKGKQNEKAMKTKHIKAVHFSSVFCHVFFKNAYKRKILDT